MMDDKNFSNTSIGWWSANTVIIALVVVLFVAIIAGAAYLYFGGGNQHTPIHRIGDQQKEFNDNGEVVIVESQLLSRKVEVGWLENGRFTSNTENISLALPEDWGVIKTSDLEVDPKFIYQTVFAFGKKDSDCVIAYGSENKNIDTVQVSFGDRVLSENWQFDSSWYVIKSEATKNTSFSGKDRQFLEGEFRRSPLINRKPNGFYLFTKDGSPVPDTCNQDMNDVLATVIDYFEGISIDDSSRGVLWTETDFGKYGAPNEKRLLFTVASTTQNFEVINFGDSVKHAGRILVHNNKLYFTGSNEKKSESYSPATIKEVDPFSGTVSSLVEHSPVEENITSIYLHDDEIYYLSSFPYPEVEYCGDCVGKLYKTNLSGDVELLADRVFARTILGFNEDDQALYLLQSWGDAGCFVSRISKYVDGAVHFVDSPGGCGGDPGFKESQEILRQYKNTKYYDYFELTSVKVFNKTLEGTEKITHYMRSRLGRSSRLDAFLFDWSEYYLRELEKAQ